ncbi:MAG: bifunctional phosphoribosyl-AMP cyclohydrolase/phosphoribosyl-ATP diphosphatase HisIE [Myxococcales bacterium]|nr:bifunctional phosphoribosyl-AMP cyclohydrolase/phosphoribosyl-ATP diphosphatase HisIE [Myxococcales bacterium]
MNEGTTAPGEAGERRLIPAIVQDARTGRVLMLAWMDDEARALTETTREVHFFSRSRQKIWRKGETSGNVLDLVSLHPDCDGDTLLIRALPRGPACHTGAQTCFGNEGPEPSPTALDELEATIAARAALPPGSRSYVRQLLDGGWPKILGKLAEESAELGAELPEGPRGRVVSEAADALFHLLIALAARGIPLADVEAEIARRADLSGLDEKARRPR